MELYCPEGNEWFKRGFVTIRPPIGCQKFETINDIMDFPNDECEKIEITDGLYQYHRKMEVDKGHYIQKAITFDKFLEMDIDIILTTHFGHEQSFHHLVAMHKPNAKFIRQIANLHEKPSSYCKNILLQPIYHPADYEDEPPNRAFKKLGINYMFYYPEHYEGYCYTEPTNHKLVVNLAPDLLPEDVESFNSFQSDLPDFKFVLCGRNPNVSKEVFPYALPNGFIPHLLLPKAIKDSAFIWYTKSHGGGGFTFRQALACGRPIIGRKHYSKLHAPMESEMYQHKINCIDLDETRKGPSLLREWSEPTQHIERCKNVAETFNRYMNFAEKAKEINTWIDTLPRGVI